MTKQIRVNISLVSDDKQVFDTCYKVDEGTDVKKMLSIAGVEYNNNHTYAIYSQIVDVDYILEDSDRLEVLRPLRRSKILESFIPHYDLKFTDILSFNRIKIWKSSISFIIQRPLFGWGASTFSALYMLHNKDFRFFHTHNLLLEVSHNYGIIVSIILFATIFHLLRKTNQKLFSSKCSLKKELKYPDIDKYWWTSSFLILFLHLSDITYYDGRISIIFWLLLSGLVMNLREAT